MRRAISRSYLLLADFLFGMATAIDISGAALKPPKPAHRARSVQEALRSDMNRIGQDLFRVVERERGQVAQAAPNCAGSGPPSAAVRPGEDDGAPPDRPPPPARITSVEQKVEQYAGPLPHPSTLKAFDDIVPGSAARILDNWEREGDHRRGLEREDNGLRREVIRKQVGIQGRGQVFGLIVALACPSASAMASALAPDASARLAKLCRLAL
ncbi:MAG TPA: DUF2335 domain-containing protein [Polyangia bacterium]|nr:DUF2335 domain-containing protein [Polyangia bacterium]